MDPWWELLGAAIAFAGATFLFLGALGMLRMPDAYTRIQAGTKASTLGVALSLLGLGIYHPAWLPKLLVIALFALLTNPVSAHALARAAHKAGVPMRGPSMGDALADHEAHEAHTEATMAARAAGTEPPPPAPSAQETAP